MKDYVKEYDEEHCYINEQVVVNINGMLLEGTVIGVQDELFSGGCEYLVKLEQGTEQFFKEDDVFMIDKGEEEC